MYAVYEIQNYFLWTKDNYPGLESFSHAIR